MFANRIINSGSDIKCNFFGFNNIEPVWANAFNNQIESCYMGLCIQRKPQLKYCLSDRVANMEVMDLCCSWSQRHNMMNF